MNQQTHDIFDHYLAGTLTATQEIAHYWYDKHRFQRAIESLLADGNVPLLDEAELRRRALALTPHPESRLAKTQRKLRRSARKRWSFLKARRLAAARYLTSPEYLSRLRKLTERLELDATPS